MATKKQSKLENKKKIKNKYYLWNCTQPIVCLLFHGAITTYINLLLCCEICSQMLIEVCSFCLVVLFIRRRLSVGIKRFTYLLTYLLT